MHRTSCRLGSNGPTKHHSSSRSCPTTHPMQILRTQKSLAIPLPRIDTGDDIGAALAALPAAWAFCLSTLNGGGKACFGILVSRRDESIDGTAGMTGPNAAVVLCAADLTTLDNGNSLLAAVRKKRPGSDTIARSTVSI